MAANNTIRFYDLTMASGCTTSPFVWSTRYALAHKGFDLDVVPGGFTGIMERTGGRTERLPAIEDDGEWVLDSWGIVEYLDAKYPDRPLLIPHESVAVLTRMMDSWWWATAVGPWMRCFCADYRDACFEHDKEYVTSSREIFMGQSLEATQADREERLPHISADIEPLRFALKDRPWLGGEIPNYADYRMIGPVLWAASLCGTPFLAADDPLRDWIERCRDLFCGIGRHPGMKAIFGLEQREGDPDLFDRGSWRGGIHARNTGPASTRIETERITPR